MDLTTKTLEYYNDNAASFVGDTVNAKMNSIQEEFLQYVKEGGRILDLGCGSGRDSKLLLDRGYEVVAIDGSRELCKVAADYTGIDVVNTTFQDYQTDLQFDGIWACASLLHVPINELQLIIHKYVGMLCEGGVFYMSFKYGEFEGDRNGRFFTDMTEKRLHEIIDQIPGAVIISENVTGDSRPGRSDEKWLNAYVKRSER